MASIKNIERSPKVATFMRNVGKSFKIIASDVLEKENLIPQTRKQFKEYNDYFNEIKIRRNEKRDLIMSSRQLNRSRIYDSSNKFMERAWDELKSNPIYEQEREEYFEDEAERDISSSDLNQSIQNSGRATSTMIGRVGEYIISNMRISDNLQKNSSLKILNSITQGFKITNNYLDKIATNTSQLSSHMSNSLTFYQNMLSLQKQSVEIQMAMYDMQNAINSKSGYKQNTKFDKIFDKDKGNFDFREYIKEVGTNMATMLSSNNPTNGLMYKIVSPILSTDLAKLKTNPIETILSLSTRLAIRNISAIEGLVKTVSEGIDNFFPNLIGKIANLSSSDNPIIKKIMSNPIAAKILPMLGIKVEENTTIDPGKFDKGPVPFDGVTRRTIVKTIPEYLARIESALTGKEERYMDNISGKWIKKSQVKARNQEIRDTGFKAGTKAVRDQIQGYLASNGMTDQIYNDITDSFLREMYNKGGMFIQNISAGGIDRRILYKIARQKGLTASEAQRVVKSLDSEAVRNKARSSFFDFNKGKNQENKIIASEEAKGYDLLTQEVDTMARGGRVRGRRGQPTLAIMTAGEKVVNTFGPRQTAINAANESAYARSLGLNVPMYATGTNPLRTARDFAVNTYGKVKEKGSELLETLRSNDMADLVMEFAPNADKNKVQTILNKTATAIPRGLKGAGIGGIIGLLTGMPLIGLAVGSGIGIASVSDTVKDFLFGKDEEINPETGEVVSPGKKGVIPKSWTDFAKKAIPAAKLGGIIGGAAGLLTSGIGILPAAVIGAGAGVALSSNKVREFLFGRTNEKGEFEDTGLIKKKVQDYVKAKAPGMTLGAVGGVVSTLLGAGPFGLLGNAVLGAGTSLLVTSDKFKDFMLGKEDENGKRSGGLLGDLKLRVLDPLINAGQELLEEGKKFFRVNVFDNVKKFLGTTGALITNTIADFRYMLANMISDGSVPIDETLGSYTRGAINFGKKVLTAPVRLLAGAAALPFRALGGISNRITDRMISRGNASNMTAQERLNYRRTRRGRLGRYSDSYAEADKTLADASLEDLRKLYVVSNLGGPNIEGFTETAADAIHRFTDFILKNREQIPIKEKSLRKLQKDMAHGDSKAFSKHLNSLREINSIQKSRIYDAVDNDLVALQELRDKQGDLRTSQSRSMKYIKETFGIKGRFGRLQLGRFNRGLEKEIGSREAANKAESDKTNIIDPNGNQYENAFRNVVSEKLDRLISLLGKEVENTNITKEAAQKTVEEQKTLAGQAGLTRDEDGNLIVRENATASNSRSRFNIINRITRLKENIVGTVKSIPKTVTGFLFGKDKDGETIFQRHGILGYIPAAIFGDDQSPGLLGNTLLGKGVKIFGRILKGLLIAAAAAPIVGQAVHFLKTTLKPVWSTVIKPWWNEHIVQPITERLKKIKVSIFGEKKVSEDGEVYYEGGLLSGLLSTIRKPIGKIRDFFNGLKAKWQELEEKSGSKTFGGVLKYLFAGNGKLVTRESDGLWSSNDSLIGNALKFILNGYKFLAQDIATPITDFFKDKVLPWVENTAAPWLSGLLQTLVHNILHKNDQWDFNKDRLIAMGGSSNKGNLSTGGWQYNSASDTYTNVNTGAVTKNINETTGLNGLKKVFKTGINGSKSIKLEVSDGFGGTTMATISSNYYEYTILPIDRYKDKNCKDIYLITLKLKSNLNSLQIVAGGVGIGGDIGVALGGKYICYKTSFNTFKYAKPLYERSKGTKIGNQNINDYGLETDEFYDNKRIYLCASNGKKYIEKGNKLVDATSEIYSTGGTTITDNGFSHLDSGSGFSRNHIYQNDPRIRNTRFGKSTIGDAGCGPVAAANLMGGALGYATNYAQKGGFINSDGSTSINYFSSMFNGRNTTSREEVKNRLKNNKPVVLLGQDNYNGVYGSNNHFVTAKGYDGSGNIIVEDPDLPQSSMRYPANKVFKGMKAASLIGGKRRLDNKMVSFENSTSESSYTPSSYTTNSESTGNTISSIFGKLGNLASLIFKKTFGITWDDVSGSTSGVGNSGIFDYGSSLSDGGTESKTFTIKGNQRTRFVEVAKSQVGYREGSNNNTKYGAWYGANNNSWCVMFISWCAEKAGIPSSVIPKMASTTAMCNWFNENNRLHLRTSMYIPLPGDIVFFTGNGTKGGLKHTGMVEAVNGTALITIEGNYSDKVTRREYTNFFSNSSIYAFGSPSFTDDYRTITVEGYGSGSVYSVEDQNGNTVYDANDEKQKIWRFLRNKAGLSPIGASGLFGAWEAESGVKPKTVEGYYLNGFPGYDYIKTNAGMNDFTKNVLFPAYDYHKDKNGNLKPIKINKNAYKVGDNYYPGLGLAQWTGPRGKGLFDYVRNNGYSSIWDTDAQLNYAKSEFDKSYPSLIGNLNNAATPEEAARIALDGYEMYNGFAATHPDTLAPRAKNARAYYDKYKGLGRNYRESRNPIAYGPSGYSGYARGSYVSYEAFLETIIQILINISNNTDAVNKILDVLSSEGANLSAKARAEISNAVSSTSSIQNLKDSLRNSMSGRSTGISSMIGNSRTDLIIKTMKEIAAQ